jgi:MoxR-like ATPase
VTHLSSHEWGLSNQRYLRAALSVVFESLSRCVGDPRVVAEKRAVVHDDPTAELEAAERALTTPSALSMLCSTFGLSSFERDVVLLCAGVELDSGIASLCAAAHGDVGRPYATFSLALSTLSEPHWSAISPDGPLRRWRLVEVGDGRALTTAPLRIDERILHYLTGIAVLDDRLFGLVQPLTPGPALVPSHSAAAGRIVASWSRARMNAPIAVVNVHGGDATSRRDIAAAASAAVGLRPHVLQASDMPRTPSERMALARLWDREAVLGGLALVIEYDGTASDSDAERTTRAFADAIRSATVLSSRDPWNSGQRSVLRIDVQRPTTAEQRGLWLDALGPLAQRVNGELDRVLAQFDLDAESIRSARAALDAYGDVVPGAAPPLWESCRVQARPRLDDIAQRIRPIAGWDDLVVPDAQRQTLREIALQMRHRATVYQQWGFAEAAARGLGVSALFAGPSGTGKTMAAEVLARELELDLYRIDLSAVVSKYIGETEKNLRRVFDAAEQGGAILLFDEADALFGKRSDVKDSHDRYANIEVSYLLQRIEAYRGMAILTTNLKTALDTAFLRRIRFVVQFPFPDVAQRLAIWQRVFPERAPVDVGDFAKLARLNVAGGSIRNIALNSAFLAAGDGGVIQSAHVLRAVRAEYAKLEKPLTDAEIAGWS